MVAVEAQSELAPGMEDEGPDQCQPETGAGPVTSLVRAAETAGRGLEEVGRHAGAGIGHSESRPGRRRLVDDHLERWLPMYSAVVEKVGENSFDRELGDVGSHRVGRKSRGELAARLISDEATLLDHAGGDGGHVAAAAVDPRRCAEIQ